MTSRTGLKSLDIKKIREQQGMNKKMPKQVRIKIIVDLLMTVLLMLLMAFELIGREEHEWLGVGMFAAFVVHHILNRKWTAHLLKGKYPPFSYCADGSGISGSDLYDIFHGEWNRNVPVCL